MIRIFVSSTFRDMHFERDLMHQKVLPAVNEKAAKFGETVELCDLRWGVATSDAESEEEANRKVLWMCLEEIDECRPYMIVLLGGRYGFCPDQETVRDVIRERNDRLSGKPKSSPFRLENEEISVTELEIRYGALYPSPGDHKVLFYRRELQGSDIPGDYLPENETAGEKQQSLIRQIEENKEKDKPAYKVSPYRARWDGRAVTDLDTFAEQLVRDVEDILDEEKKESENLTGWKKEFQIHNKYAESRRRNFFGRKDEIEEIQNCLRKGDQNLIAVSAKSGLGKTSLMSQLTESLKITKKQAAAEAETETETKILFCGYTPATCRALDLVRAMLEFLKKQLKRSTSTPADSFSDPDPESTDLELWRAALEERIDRYREIQESEPPEQRKKLIILLDALDQLDDDDGRRNLAFLPENLSEWTRIVVSYVPSFPDVPSLDSPVHPDRTISLPPFTDDPDKDAVLRGLLRAEGKEVDSRVLAKIEGKEDSSSPLYLSLIAMRLDRLRKRDFDEIDRKTDESGDHEGAVVDYQTQIIRECPGDLPGFCRHLISGALRAEGGKERQIIGEALHLISVSRFGLREQDLAGILTKPYGGHEQDGQWDSLEFHTFYWSLREMFLERDDGRIDFSHKTIREGYLLNRKEDDDREDHRRIFWYLIELPPRDPVRINEIIYHGWHADEKEGVVQFLAGYQETEPDEENGHFIIYRTAAREVLRMCLDVYYEDGRDQTSWFEEVLEQLNPWKNKKETFGLLSFLFDCFGSVAGTSEPELILQERLYRRGLTLIEKLHNDRPDEDTAACLARAYNILGRIQYLLGGRSNYCQSLYFYQKGQELTEEGQTGSMLTNRQKRNMFLEFGDIYAALGGMQSRNDSLRYYLKAEDLKPDTDSPSGGSMEDLRTEWKIQIRIADSLMSGNLADRKEGISRYGKVIRSMKGKKISSGDIQSGRLLIQALVHLGDARMKVYGYSDPKAQDRYREAEKKAENLSGRTRNPEDSANCILCKEMLAFVAGLTGSEKATEGKDAQSAAEEPASEEKSVCLNEMQKIRNGYTSLPDPEKTQWIPARYEVTLLDHEATVLMSNGDFGEAAVGIEQAIKILESPGYTSSDDERSDSRRDEMVLYAKLGKCCQKTQSSSPVDPLEKAYNLAEELEKYWSTRDSHMDAFIVGCWLAAVCEDNEERREILRKCDERSAVQPDLIRSGKVPEDISLYCWPVILNGQ